MGVPEQLGACRFHVDSLGSEEVTAGGGDLVLGWGCHGAGGKDPFLCICHSKRSPWAGVFCLFFVFSK